MALPSRRVLGEGESIGFLRQFRLELFRGGMNRLLLRSRPTASDGRIEIFFQYVQRLDIPMTFEGLSIEDATAEDGIVSPWDEVLIGFPEWLEFWYLFRYHTGMDAARLLRTARHEAGLTLRELGARAGTSHSTLAAYESGSKSPNVTTLDRVLRAAGFATDVELHRRHRGSAALSRGEELAAVLELAAEFPARHAPLLEAPVFGRAQ